MKTRARWLMSLVLVLSLSAASRAADAPKPALEAGDLVAVCGDSITEQKDYSVVIEDYLLMCQPAASLRAVQAGWGGEQAPGFLARMERDVLVFHPNVVTTCYGMNDGHYGPMQPATAKTYRDAQKAIVQGLKKAGVRVIVVGSPGVVDLDTFGGGHKEPGQPSRAEIYNPTLAGLRDIARDVAKEENVLFANVFDPMMDVMLKAKQKYGPKYHVGGGDGVHPAHNGHLVMAYAYLRALGCDGQIGTITMDLAGSAASASEGHKIVVRTRDQVEVESRRYPFCFFGDPSSPDSTRGPLEFLPFNEELNRFRFVVSDAKADARYKVTWGKASKEFSGEQLAKGINLAAEFADTPFAEAFRKVDQAVRAQQNYETPLTKDLLHNLSERHRNASEQEKAKIVADLLKQDKDLFGKAVAAMKPVRHTIKVEAVETVVPGDSQSS
jgi:lysophospholipase L1-like esterase